MELNPSTKIDQLLEEHPFLIEYLINRSPKYKLLQSTVMRKTVGRVATLSEVAVTGGIEIGHLLGEIAAEISSKTGKTDIVVNKTAAAQEDMRSSEVRTQLLKDIIRELHAGVDMAILKKRFFDLIKDIDAAEIARMEQQLIEEGMPDSEVKRLCDVHVKVFEESLGTKEKLKMPEGHPVHTFMLENRALVNIIQQTRELLDRLGTPIHEQMFRFSSTNFSV